MLKLIIKKKRSYLIHIWSIVRENQGIKTTCNCFIEISLMKIASQMCRKGNT